MNKITTRQTGHIYIALLLTDSSNQSSYYAQYPVKFNKRFHNCSTSRSFELSTDCSSCQLKLHSRITVLLYRNSNNAKMSLIPLSGLISKFSRSVMRTPHTRPSDEHYPYASYSEAPQYPNSPCTISRHLMVFAKTAVTSETVRGTASRPISYTGWEVVYSYLSHSSLCGSGTDKTLISSTTAMICLFSEELRFSRFRAEYTSFSVSFGGPRRHEGKCVRNTMKWKSIHGCKLS